MPWLRARLSYANCMATLAVFISLGGGALAATKLGGSGGVINGCVGKQRRRPTGRDHQIRAGGLT